MGELIGNIIFAVCCIGCSMSFFCYGKWIARQEKPVGFWANKPFDGSRIKDISGYNREYGKLFQGFSIAPGLAGLTMLLFFEYLSLAILILWIIPGIFWLIRSYRAIEKKYIV